MKHILILLMLTFCFSTTVSATPRDFDDGIPKISQMVDYQTPTTLEIATPFMSNEATIVSVASIPIVPIYDVGSIYLPSKSVNTKYEFVEHRIRKSRRLLYT